ncbi:MAG: hypothetical protein AAGN46_01265 [Acidobacteriota bacterium]
METYLETPPLAAHLARADDVASEIGTAADPDRLGRVQDAVRLSFEGEHGARRQFARCAFTSLVASSGSPRLYLDHGPIEQIESVARCGEPVDLDAAEVRISGDRSALYRAGSWPVSPVRDGRRSLDHEVAGVGGWVLPPWLLDGWSATTTISAGSWLAIGGVLFTALIGGDSGAAEPTWADDSDVSDGEVTWRPHPRAQRLPQDLEIAAVHTVAAWYRGDAMSLSTGILSENDAGGFISYTRDDGRPAWPRGVRGIVESYR